MAQTIAQNFAHKIGALYSTQAHSSRQFALQIRINFARVFGANSHLSQKAFFTVSLRSLGPNFTFKPERGPFVWVPYEVTQVTLK